MRKSDLRPTEEFNKAIDKAVEDARAWEKLCGRRHTPVEWLAFERAFRTGAHAAWNAIHLNQKG